MNAELHPVLTIRLFTDQKCFGPGVATLLHRVREHHSLRAAAASMEMAYSKAWTILKNAENCLGFPLLSSSRGGKNGGGAALTQEAVKLLDAYDRYSAALRDQAAAWFPDYFGAWAKTEETL